jgi:hypothetical protein
MAYEQYFPMAASFLFVFAITYALLLKSSILGNTKGASVIVAIVMASFSVLYGPAAAFLITILPTAGIILVILFVVAFARDILGLKGGDKKDALPEVVLLFISLLVLAGIMPRLGFIDPQALLFIGGLIIVFLLFYAIYRHPKVPKN